jgi:cell division protein FtsQ
MKILTIEEGKQLLELIEFVNEDKFWKAQIAQLDINKLTVRLPYPQMTGQRVVQFGKQKDRMEV